MARVDNLTNFLTDVADAIRLKTGGTEDIQASDFDTEIESIETGADLSNVLSGSNIYKSLTVNTTGLEEMAQDYSEKLSAMDVGNIYLWNFEWFDSSGADTGDYDYGELHIANIYPFFAEYAPIGTDSTYTASGVYLYFYPAFTSAFIQVDETLRVWFS